MTDGIPTGSRWLEVETNRTIIVIIGEGPNSPWFRFEDEPDGGPWYCCAEDFFLWGRFRRLT